MFELSQKFYFEAAHTLQRTIDAEGSRRIHGHTYHAEATVLGRVDRIPAWCSNWGTSGLQSRQ
jgi:6-pyruvoyltetrahydropterin/6-carboxytetrahydropterin synthase